MCLTEQEAKEYRDYLEKLAKCKSSKMFSNGGKEHAVVLYSVLLNHTKEKARFFCEGCMSVIWQHPVFRSALADALRKDKFSVDILRKYRTDVYPDFSWLPEHLREKIDVRTVTESGLERINDHFHTTSCNFSVFDKEKFRFEYDVENYKAYGSFNEESIAGSMVSLFERCFSEA